MVNNSKVVLMFDLYKKLPDSFIVSLPKNCTINTNSGIDFDRWNFENRTNPEVVGLCEKYPEHFFIESISSKVSSYDIICEEHSHKEYIRTVSLVPKITK